METVAIAAEAARRGLTPVERIIDGALGFVALGAFLSLVAVVVALSALCNSQASPVVVRTYSVGEDRADGEGQVADCRGRKRARAVRNLRPSKSKSGRLGDQPHRDDADPIPRAKRNVSCGPVSACPARKRSAQSLHRAFD
jgi:hypothetical protein